MILSILRCKLSILLLYYDSMEHSWIFRLIQYTSVHTSIVDQQLGDLGMLRASPLRTLDISDAHRSGSKCSESLCKNCLLTPTALICIDLRWKDAVFLQCVFASYGGWNGSCFSVVTLGGCRRQLEMPWCHRRWPGNACQCSCQTSRGRPEIRFSMVLCNFPSPCFSVCKKTLLSCCPWVVWSSFS